MSASTSQLVEPAEGSVPVVRGQAGEEAGTEAGGPAERQGVVGVGDMVPAMSMCAHGVPATNSSRNRAAVVAPACGPPRFEMSATSESSCLRYFRSSGLPTGCPSPAAAGDDLVDHALVVAEGTAARDLPRAISAAPVRVAMSMMASTRLDGQREAVHHRDPALRVGVLDLDGLAVAARGRRPACRPNSDGMLSVQVSHPDTAAVVPRSRRAGECAENCGRVAHVHLHQQVHRVGRLGLMPPESYMMPLPTRPRWPVTSPSGV